MNAILTCSDGTVIKISKETEDELRKAFGNNKPPKYEDAHLSVEINNDRYKCISIGAGLNTIPKPVTRTIYDAQRFRDALTEMIEYCKKYNLGV